MTRVNLIPVQELHHKHLVAEYRENPRIFGMVRRAQDRGVTPTTLRAPDTYTLGPGHCKFFYPRLQWLLTRQALLVDEMLRRGYRPSHTLPSELLSGIHDHWVRDWTPDEAAILASRQRIEERLGTMK